MLFDRDSSRECFGTKEFSELWVEQNTLGSSPLWNDSLKLKVAFAIKRFKSVIDCPKVRRTVLHLQPVVGIFP